MTMHRAGELVSQWCIEAQRRKMLYHDMTHELAELATVRSKHEVAVIGEAAAEALRGVEWFCSRCVGHQGAGEAVSLEYLLDEFKSAKPLKWPLAYAPVCVVSSASFPWSSPICPGALSSSVMCICGVVVGGL